MQLFCNRFIKFCFSSFNFQVNFLVVAISEISHCASHRGKDTSDRYHAYLKNLILQLTDRFFVILNKLGKHLTKALIHCHYLAAELMQPRLIDYSFANKILQLIQFLDGNTN